MPRRAAFDGSNSGRPDVRGRAREARAVPSTGRGRCVRSAMRVSTWRICGFAASVGRVLRCIASCWTARGRCLPASGLPRRRGCWLRCSTAPIVTVRRLRWCVSAVARRMCGDSRVQHTGGTRAGSNRLAAEAARRSRSACVLRRTCSRGRRGAGPRRSAGSGCSRTDAAGRRHRGRSTRIISSWWILMTLASRWGAVQRWLLGGARDIAPLPSLFSGVWHCRSRLGLVFVEPSDAPALL